MATLTADPKRTRNVREDESESEKYDSDPDGDSDVMDLTGEDD